MVWSKMKVRVAPVLYRSVSEKGSVGRVRYAHVLEKLINLFIIPIFDLLIIQKSLLITDMRHELEALTIECVLVFFPSHVVDPRIMGIDRPLICLGTTDISRLGWRAIVIRLEEVQHGVDVVFLNLGAFGDDQGC